LGVLNTILLLRKLLSRLTAALVTSAQFSPSLNGFVDLNPCICSGLVANAVDS
jgi:hypothetical protein